MVNSTRPDGRSFYDPRPFNVDLNPLRTGPSCRLSVGEASSTSSSPGERTSVIALVYFSVDNKNRNTVGSYHRPTFEVYVRPVTGPVKGYIRAYECMLLKCLQSMVDGSSLGRVLVSVRLQILEESSGLFAACLNALITAMIVAGLPLRETPHAIQIGILHRNDSPGFIVEPTSEELRMQCSSAITMLCSPKSGNILFLSIDHGCGCYDAGLQANMEAVSRKIAELRLSYLNKKYREAFEAARISFEANGS
ncbi:exosome complex exonuclease RRP46 homolog [Babesia ovis]|uniref:Exosome complex exonuclease RRP46 homolog n=1 Tax=Babesia ovis TaxID=5869 RepID=A0A9W5TA42_BABOV|nr:exosome complex exonuclease RRP46 homolog [Babesia ovis]